MVIETWITGLRVSAGKGTLSPNHRSRVTLQGFKIVMFRTWGRIGTAAAKPVQPCLSAGKRIKMASENNENLIRE